MADFVRCAPWSLRLEFVAGSSRSGGVVAGSVVPGSRVGLRRPWVGLAKRAYTGAPSPMSSSFLVPTPWPSVLCDSTLALYRLIPRPVSGPRLERVGAAALGRIIEPIRLTVATLTYLAWARASAPGPAVDPHLRVEALLRWRWVGSPLTSANVP